MIDVTDEYDVPLMVSRGYASLSFLHSAAENMEAEDRPCFIYHFGDFDPSGVNAAEKIDETLNELAPTAEIHFQRVAVTPEQIARLDLPTRPTKTTDTRSKSWGGGDESVELDAIEPDTLRDHGARLHRAASAGRRARAPARDRGGRARVDARVRQRLEGRRRVKGENTMWIMRAAPGKWPKIVCSECDKRAAYAGDAVPEFAVEWSDEPDGPVMVIEHEMRQPLL